MSDLREGCAICKSVINHFNDMHEDWAGDESGVILHNELGVVGWDDSCTLGRLLEGKAGGWGGVILLNSATRGWCWPRCQDEHLYATAKKQVLLR